MSDYFENFPLVKYQGVFARDLTRRANFLKSTVANPYVFLPYTVEDDMRPEDVAYYYYGSTEYTWLVYLSNNMLDPYHQWPMTQENFEQYIIKKYADQSGKTGYDVLDWTKNETIDENILYYYKEVWYTVMTDIIKLSPDSFKTIYLRKEDNIILRTEQGRRIILEKLIPEEWIPYRIYDYENAINENKRNIYLIDKSFLPRIDEEFRDKLK